MISKQSIVFDGGDRLRNAKTIARGVLIALCLICASSLLAQNATTGSKTPRKVLLKVQPQYPPILRDGRFEGQVRLQATVRPDGNVARVENRGGNPMLSQFAEEAVMHWKYAPAAGQTVEEVVFNFGAGSK
ncbi:MAG: TonB family protein [Candidatus Sulfotelmatobacter sp.]